MDTQKEVLTQVALDADTAPKQALGEVSPVPFGEQKATAAAKVIAKKPAAPKTTIKKEPVTKPISIKPISLKAADKPISLNTADKPTENKVVENKVVEKKAVPKKPDAEKKPTAKKPTAKKAAATKPTAKKAAAKKATSAKASGAKVTTVTRVVKKKSPLKNKAARDVDDDYGLKLFFQPIYVPNENRVFGYECLLRIVDKDLGVITPDAFLNVAKKNVSLMKGLEDWSMSELFRIAKLFRDSRKYIEMISLNIDTNNFFRKDFYERMSKYFDKINENIYIELKEDAFFSSDPVVTETLIKLRHAGIKIAVDDFTANFLTFEWDDQLPFDMIKIDRAFIDRFMISPKAKLIIEKIIAFAALHKVDLVAVGIENADQEKELLAMGCTMMQGYYYAKPLQIKRLLED